MQDSRVQGSVVVRDFVGGPRLHTPAHPAHTATGTFGPRRTSRSSLVRMPFLSRQGTSQVDRADVDLARAIRRRAETHRLARRLADRRPRQAGTRRPPRRLPRRSPVSRRSNGTPRRTMPPVVCPIATPTRWWPSCQCRRLGGEGGSWFRQADLDGWSHRLLSRRLRVWRQEGRGQRANRRWSRAAAATAAAAGRCHSRSRRLHSRSPLLRRGMGGGGPNGKAGGTARGGTNPLSRHCRSRPHRQRSCGPSRRLPSPSGAACCRHFAGGPHRRDCNRQSRPMRPPSDGRQLHSQLHSPSGRLHSRSRRRQLHSRS